MFCPDGANVGSWKLVIERIVEHLQCVWISGSPNYLNIMVAKWIYFATPLLGSSFKDETASFFSPTSQH